MFRIFFNPFSLLARCVCTDSRCSKKILISRIFPSKSPEQKASPIRFVIASRGSLLVLEFIANSKIYNKERKEGRRRQGEKGLWKIWGSQDVTFTKCGCRTAVQLLPSALHTIQFQTFFHLLIMLVCICPGIRFNTMGAFYFPMHILFKNCPKICILLQF